MWTIWLMDTWECLYWMLLFKNRNIEKVDIIRLNMPSTICTTISCSCPHFSTLSINPQPPSVHPETEDGVQTDAGEGLERGGDAGVLGAHRFGTAGLHRGQGRGSAACTLYLLVFSLSPLSQCLIYQWLSRCMNSLYPCVQLLFSLFLYWRLCFDFFSLSFWHSTSLYIKGTGWANNPIFKLKAELVSFQIVVLSKMKKPQQILLNIIITLSKSQTCIHQLFEAFII